MKAYFTSLFHFEIGFFTGVSEELVPFGFS